MSLSVAAYCRVSTDREDQVNSLHSQQTYFRDYIRGHGDWTLAEVYADEGTSGTSTRRREAFNRMIRDAGAGRFQLILTKEVSRFARNTVDALEYTRRLKGLGVGVIFINDGIDTRDNDGELRLTLMASMAQEESRKTSERVKWGQKRRMEAGVVFGNDSTFGFETRGGALFLKEEEAQVVRHIFSKFLHEGKGTHVIARELYEEGIAPPKTATGKWSCVMVRRILRNEKYAGDLLQKKYVTVDYLTHRKVENRGQEEQIYLRDHHAAIVDRGTWEAVQKELARRGSARGEGSKYSNRYWCSGKIRCGACGSRFVPRSTKRPNGEIYRTWGCHNRVRYGSWKGKDGEGSAGCHMRMLNDKTLAACARFVIQELVPDGEQIAAELLAQLRRVRASAGEGAALGQLRLKRGEIQRKKQNALDSFLGGVLSRDELTAMRDRYDGELALLDQRIRGGEEAARAAEERGGDMEAVARAVRAGVYGSEEVFREVVQSVTVWEDWIDIRVNHLPGAFRLRYTVRGRGAGYTTQITGFERL